MPCKTRVSNSQVWMGRQVQGACREWGWGVLSSAHIPNEGVLPARKGEMTGSSIQGSGEGMREGL